MESFKIMDYSLLIGVHNIDLEINDDNETGEQGCSNLEEERNLLNTKEFRIANKNDAWKSLQLDFNTSKGVPYE